MRATDSARLLAAATIVKNRLHDLENDRTATQGYLLENLVEACRKLGGVVDALNAQESTGSSGSVLPD